MICQIVSIQSPRCHLLGNTSSYRHSPTMIGKESLPLEDSATFSGPKDRQTDSNLKRIYSVTGAARMPAIMLSSISRALKVWVMNIEMALNSGVELTKIVMALEEIYYRISSRIVHRPGEASSKTHGWQTGHQNRYFGTSSTTTRCCLARP